MSHETESPSSQKAVQQPKIQTEQLELMQMTIGESVYHIEVKQHGQSRFMRIIEAPMKKGHTRVVVPMCLVDDISNRITEVYNFCAKYKPVNASAKLGPQGRPESAFTVNYQSEGGRLYYFDVIDIDGCVSMRMTYIFGSRRESIVMIYDALPKLLGILRDSYEKHPSLSKSDDYRVPYRKNNYNNTRRFSNRNYNNQQRPRTFRPRGNYRGATGAPTNTEAGSVIPRRPEALKVWSDPAPAFINSNTKRFTVEIVEGVNTFFRITEMINESRKSTLHVPVEVAAQLQSALNDMNKKYHQKVASNSQPSGSTKA